MAAARIFRSVLRPKSTAAAFALIAICVSALAAGGGVALAAAKLQPPKLVAPANNSTVNTLTPTFSWGKVAKATSYRIQVAAGADTGYTSPLVDTTTTATSLVSPAQLADGSTYRWHVQALGDGGSNSSWSGDWQFTVFLGSAPSVSIQASPTTVVYDATSTLTWTTTNATSCTASGGWSGTKQTSGTEDVGPLTATTSFTLNCTGPGGSGGNGTTVTVTPPSVEPAFDSDHFSCAGKGVAVDETFSLQYPSCRAQLVREIQFLSQHNVRVIRIWPIVSQFFVHEPRNSQNLTYDDHLNATYIANFDDFLNVLKQNGMQVMVGLNQHTKCTVSKAGVPDIHDWMRFNYGLFYAPSKPNLLPSYLNGLKLFAAHYKDNTTIRSYDLLNEVNNLFDEALVNYPQDPAQVDLWTRCLQTAPPDHDTLRADVESTLRQIRDTLKSVDTRHNVTFSYGASTAQKAQDGVLDPGFFSFFSSLSDYYDFHIYTHLPNGNGDIKHPKDWFDKYWATMPSDKTVMLGEDGIFNGETDKNGNICETSITSNAGQFTPMNSDCQSDYLLNNQQYIEQAEDHGVTSIYYHSLWEHNGYAYAIYDSTGKFTSFAWSLGAAHIFATDKIYYGL